MGSLLKIILNEQKNKGFDMKEFYENELVLGFDYELDSKEADLLAFEEDAISVDDAKEAVVEVIVEEV